MLPVLADVSAAIVSVDVATLVCIINMLDGRSDDASVFLCGNGGSAATCLHFEVELTKEVRAQNGRVLNLAANLALITALANDTGYEDVFSHQIRRLGRPNDILIVFSASGESPNIISALKSAKTRRMMSVAFTGELPNTAAALSDRHVAVKSKSAGTIESCHIAFIHAITNGLNRR